MIALFDGAPACFVRRGAADFFLATVNHGIELGRVEVRQADRLIREDGEARRPGLGKAAGHKKAQFCCRCLLDHDNAWLHARDQRRVVLEDGEFALRSGNGHGLRFSRKDEFFGGNDFKMKSRHRIFLDLVSWPYAASAASFCAFSTASSMAPTI